MTALDQIHEFLPCPTPQAWIQAALEQQSTLLVDHANCEKKAAGTALKLLYRYQDDFDLISRLSRLAREELRHFEQVVAIMRRRGIDYVSLSASRYAAGLRKLVRTREPGRLVDTLVVAAIIEARSCERFACLAPRLDQELRQFYTSLLRSEARHYRVYLSLAQKLSDAGEVATRVELLCTEEQNLIESPDRVFRFHSGVPPRA